MHSPTSPGPTTCQVTQTLLRAQELDLLRRVLQGDQGASTAFCQKYEALIFGCVLKVLRRYTVAYSADDLADLVAEVWLTLLRDDKRKLKLFDPSRGLRVASWIGMLATNCTIDQLRLRAGDTAYLEDLSGVDQLLVDSRQPDSGIEERESAELARRALAELSIEERQFVLSCYHEERDPADLARDLGIAVNTVYSRKFKIREKLVRIVEGLHAPRPLALAA